MEREGPLYKIYLIGDVDQKILDGLIRIIFLREVETAIKSGIKLRFGIMCFQHK